MMILIFKIFDTDLENLNYVQVGKKYSVSDNCIRKWIKIYKKYNN